MSNDLEVVQECSSPEEAARVFLAVYDRNEFKVVGSNICVKAHGFSPHITRQYTEPGEPGPAPIEEPLTFQANTVSLVIGGKRTDYTMGNETKDVGTASPVGGPPLGFAPIQRGVGDEEEDEEEEKPHEHGEIVVPAQRIPLEPRRVPRPQGKADAASGGTPVPSAPNDGRGDSSDVRSIPDERHHRLRLGAWENALANLLHQHFDRQERVVKAKLTGAKNRDRWERAVASKPETKAYNSDQPRDEHGRFGEGGEQPQLQPRKSSRSSIDPFLPGIQERMSRFYADPANKIEILDKGADATQMADMASVAKSKEDTWWAASPMPWTPAQLRLAGGLRYLKEQLNGMGHRYTAVATHDGEPVAAIGFSTTMDDRVGIHGLGSDQGTPGAGTALEVAVAKWGVDHDATGLASMATNDAVSFHQLIGRVVTGKDNKSRWSREDMDKIAALTPQAVKSLTVPLENDPDEAPMADFWENWRSGKSLESKREQPGTVTPVIVKPPVEVGHVFDKETWKDALKADTSGMVRAIWDDFGQDAADTYGVDWTIDTPDIDSAIGTQLAGLLHVEDTTEDQISKALEKGFHHGDDVQTLSDRIGGVFDSARLLRAPMIAQQQTVAAGNGAIVNVGKQSDGQFQNKTWQTQQDEAVREWHAEADGQTVPIDAQFSVGPDMMDYPGDPSSELANQINCRCWCTLAPLEVTPWEPASAEERAAQDIVFGKSIPVFALSRSALRSPDVKVCLTRTVLNSKAKLTPVFRTSVKDDGPYGIPQNASMGQPVDDELTEGGVEVKEEQRDDHGRWTKGGAGDPLPVGRGLYYRSQPKGAKFSRANASTQNIGEAPPDMEKYWEKLPGYSAFWHPAHVDQYHQDMDWDYKGRNIIAFKGTPIGEGADGEPRVMPDSDKPEFTLTPKEFQDRLEVTPLPTGSYGDYSWGEDSEGQRVDDGYRTIGGKAYNPTEGGIPLEEKDWNPDAHPRDEHGKFISGAAVGGVVTGTGTKGKFTEDDLKPFIGRKLTITNSANDSQYSGTLASISNPDDVAASKTNPTTLYVQMEGSGSITWPDGTEESEPKMEMLGHLPIGKDDMVHVEAEEPKVEDLTKTSLEDGSIKPTGADGKYQASDLKDRVGEPLTFTNKDGEKITGKIFDAFEKDGQSYVEFAGGVGIDYADGTHEDDVDWGKMNLGNVREVMGKTIPQKMDDALQKLADATVGEVLNSKPEDEWPQEIADELSGKAPEGEKPLPTVTNPKDADMAQFTGKEVTITQASSYGAGQTYTGTQEPDPDSDKNSPMHPQFRLMGGTNNGMYYTADELDSIGLAGAPSADDQLQSYQEQTAGAKPTTGQFIQASGANGYTPADLEPFVGQKLTFGTIGGVGTATGTLTGADYDDNGKGITTFEDVHWDYGNGDTQDSDFVNMLTSDMENVSVGGKPEGTPRPTGGTVLTGAQLDQDGLKPYVGQQIDMATEDGSHFIGKLESAGGYGVWMKEGVIHWGDGTTGTIQQYDGISRQWSEITSVSVGSGQEATGAKPFSAGATIVPNGGIFTDADIQPYIGKTVNVNLGGIKDTGTVTGVEYGNLVVQVGSGKNYIDPADIQNGNTTVTLADQPSTPRVAAGTVIPLTGTKFTHDDIAPYIGKQVTATYKNGDVITGTLTGKLDSSGAAELSDIKYTEDGITSNMSEWSVSPNGGATSLVVSGGPESSAPRPTGGMVKPSGVDYEGKPVVTTDDLKPYVGKTITMSWVNPSDGKTGTVVGKLADVGKAENGGAFMKFDGDGATVTWTDGSQGHEKEWSTEGGDTVTVGEPGTGAKPGPTPTGPGGTYTTSDLDPFVGKTITITSTSGVSVTGVVQGTDSNGYGGAAGAVMFEAGGTITFKNGETKPTVNGTQMPLGQSAATIALAGEPEGSKPTGNGYVLSTVKPISGDKYSSVDLNPLLNQPVKITTNYDNTYAGVLTAVTASGIATVFTGNADDPYQDIAASKIDTLETTVPAGSRQSTGIAQPFSGGLPVIPTGEGAEYTPDHYTVGDLQGSVGKQVSFVSPTGATVTGTFSNLTADQYGDPQVDLDNVTVTEKGGISVNSFDKVGYSGNELGQFAVTPGQTGGGAEQATGSKITATGNGGKYTAGDLKPYIGKVVTITDQDGSKMVVTLSDSYTSKSGQEYAGFSPSADQTWIDKDGKSTTVGGSEGSAGINLGSTASIEVTGASVGQPTAGPLKPSDKGGGGFTDADVAPYIGKTVTATYPDGSTVTGKLVNNAGGQTLYLSDVTKMSADGTPTTISNFYVTAADPKGIGSINTGTPSSLTVEGAPVEGGRTGQPPSNMTGTGKFGLILKTGTDPFGNGSPEYTKADLQPHVGKDVMVMMKGSSAPLMGKLSELVSSTSESGETYMYIDKQDGGQYSPALSSIDSIQLIGKPGNVAASPEIPAGKLLQTAIKPSVPGGKLTLADLKLVKGEQVVAWTKDGKGGKGELVSVGSKYATIKSNFGGTLAKFPIADLTSMNAPPTLSDVESLVGKQITVTDTYGNSGVGTLDKIVKEGEPLFAGGSSNAGEGGTLIMSNVKAYGPSTSTQGKTMSTMNAPMKILGSIHEGIAPKIAEAMAKAGVPAPAAAAPVANNVAPNGKITPSGPGGKYQESDLKPHVGKPMVYLAGGVPKPGKIVSFGGDEDLRYAKILDTNTGSYVYPMLKNLGNVQLDAKPGTAVPVVAKVTASQPTGKKLSWGSTVPATGANGLHSVEDLKPYENHAVTATVAGGSKVTGLVTKLGTSMGGGATFSLGKYVMSASNIAKLESGAQPDAEGYDKSKDPKATSSYTPPVNSYEPPPPVKPDYDKTKPSATPEVQSDGVKRTSAAVAKSAGFATSVAGIKKELDGEGMDPTAAAQAARGRSLIYDGKDIEDLDVRVAKVKDADGNDAYELKFKLMPDAMDKLKTAITKDGSNWGIGQMNVSRKEFQGDHFTNSAKGYIKEEGSTAYGTIDGADVKVHYISDSQKQKDAKAEVDPYASSSSFDTPYAYDRTVQVSIPAEQFTDKKLNSVMAALGVRSAGHAQQPDVDALKAAKFANLVAGSHGAKLAAAASIDASHIKITKGGGGRVEPRISAPDAKKLADTLGVKTFYHDWKMNDDAETETEKVIDAIKMGMPNMSTTNRWSEGINQAGMSSTTDILTGGADYVFTRQSDQTPGNLRNGGGGIRLVYDAPKMLQRPDMFAYGSDSYGQARGVMYKDRDSLRNVQYGANNGGSQETMFKGRTSNDDLAAVYLPNKTLAAHAITELKAAGITTIGGKPIEDVVKSGSSY